MRNIRKSLWYQMSRDLAVMVPIVMYVVGTLLLIILSGDLDKMTGTMAAAYISEELPMILFYFINITVPQICWADLKDKTLDYEILGGHNRTKVFWTRVWVTMEVMLPVVMLPIFLDIAIPSVLHGFGHNMTAGELFSLYGMLFCIIVRMIVESILITFLVGNALAGKIGGIILGEVIMMPVAFMSLFQEGSKSGGYYSTAYRMMNVLDLSNYRMGFADGEDIVQYIITPDPFQWFMDSAGMLIIAAVLLLITFLIFKKKDI